MIHSAMLRGRRRSALAGYHCGATPFGYVRMATTRYERKLTGRPSKLAPRDLEAALVGLIFSLYRSERSMKKVIEILDEAGEKTRRGKPWTRSAINMILANPVYRGRVRWGGEVVKGAHKPIVGALTFNLVQKIRKKNNKRGRNP